MRTLLTVFALACVILHAGRTVAVDERLPSLQSVLAKWEAASQECRTLDAKLTVYRYNSVFGGSQEPTMLYGRFYYEAPNVGRYEIRESSRTGVNDWQPRSEIIVWNSTDTLCIDLYRRTVLKISGTKLREAIANMPAKPSGFWSKIFDFRRLALLAMQSPQESLPLVIDIRVKEVSDRFDVTFTRKGEKICLTALPKTDVDKTRFRKIHVLLNAKTYRTYATQVILPDEYQRSVLVLEDQKVNERPSDRDQLINPDLSGFQVSEVFP